MNLSQPRVFFIFGVAGSGKSTLGKLLSASLRIPFFDGDDYHPASNVEKMKAGIPLTDDDRQGWLESLNQLGTAEIEKGSIVIVCSALKESYRQTLMDGIEGRSVWFLMHGKYELILERMTRRTDHFMPPALLKSQFDLLEVPAYAIPLDVELSPSEILDLMLTHIGNMNSTIGIIGMGVMGSSLARNFGRNGFSLSLFNQRIEKTEVDVAKNIISKYPELSQAQGFEDLRKFVTSLTSPKLIICMIPAGDPMDQLIEKIKLLLQPDDMLVDGGNSHYKDTVRRQAQLSNANIHFMGVGISGGEEGALHGPSMMVGGASSAWKRIQPVFEKVAAINRQGKSCCAWIGQDGAGHFVKMVHNGIEYAEMQLLAELYGILRWGHLLEPGEIADIFEKWLNTYGDSYLLSVSIDVLRKKENEEWLIDKILDRAENKGTGGWTTIAAAELGVPIPTITTSLFSRFASANKKLRTQLSETLKLPVPKINFSIDSLWQTYQLARISNHQQGFHLISEASDQYGWNIDLSTLARIWTNGCIIRSVLMESLEQTFKKHKHLVQDPSFQSLIKKNINEGLSLTGTCMKANIPVPAFASALIYLQTMAHDPSYGNFIQAQRDYFGAHGYQRVDETEGKKFHSTWK